MSFFTDPPLHDFPDRALRLLLEYPDHLRDLVRAAAPDLAPGFAFSRAQKLDRAFSLPDWRRRESDLLFSIPWQEPGGAETTPALVCVLVEHQSQEDQAIALRTLLYAVLFWEREWKAWEDHHERSAPLRLTPVLPILFHTGTEPWAGPRNLADLFAVPTAMKSEILPWQPRLWDLPAQSLDTLRHAEGEWLRAMALVRAERENAGEFRAVAEETYQGLAPLEAQDKVRWHDLMWFLLSWTARRRPRSEREELKALAATSYDDASVRREVEKMSQVVEQTWEKEMMDRGMQRGMQQGMQQGLERGRQVGALETSRLYLRDLLEQRFGALPEALARQIEQTEDLKRLQGYVLQILKINNLDEIHL